MKRWFSTPKLSIVVVIYNMSREAPRTLHSLSTKHQQRIREQDYEVIVVDNGSKEPLSKDYFHHLQGNFRYFYIENASPSPAHAVNFGVQQSHGKYLGIMIDGARIASPGLLEYALRAFDAFHNPVVTALAWHLGPDIHRQAVKKYGYNQEKEDQLLKSIHWPEDGYRLFEISTLAGSSREGWFAPKTESSSLFMSRENFEYLGGYDERFDQPGGGLVNIDTYIRACEIPDSDLVMILGEGTFHQIHGGAMTGADEAQSKRNLQIWLAQYADIRKKSVMAPTKKLHYIGSVPSQALKTIQFSAENALKKLENAS